MEGLADRLDFGEGRQSRRPRRRERSGPGAATRMEGLADRLDFGEGRQSRRVQNDGANFDFTPKTPLEKRIREMSDAEIREWLNNPADNRPRDGRYGYDPRADRDFNAAIRREALRREMLKKPGGRRPAARRRDRTQAAASQASNRPRTPEASEPAGTPPPRPARRRRGPFVNIDELDAQQAERLQRELGVEAVAVNDFWRKRLGGEPTAEKIDEYVRKREREGRSPAYLGMLRAARNDWNAFGGDRGSFGAEAINDLGPTRRKKVLDRAGLLEKRPARRRNGRPVSEPKPKTPTPEPKPKTPTPEPKPKTPTPENPPPPPPRPDADDLVNGDWRGRARARSEERNGYLARQLQPNELQEALVVMREQKKDVQKEIDALEEIANKPGVDNRVVNRRLTALYDERDNITVFEGRLKGMGAVTPGSADASESNPEPPTPEKPDSEESAPLSADPPAIAPARGLLQRIRQKSKGRLAKRNKQGYAIPQRVEVGNKGINTAADAATHVRNGGDLADVPDDFLFRAIDANSQAGGRYRQLGTGGGINGMRRYEDTLTGRKIGVKFPEGEAYGFQEELNEFAGAFFAERMGFAQGVMRVGGPLPDAKAQYGGNANDRAVPIVVELGQDVVGSDINLAQQILKPDKAATRDLVRLQLLDFVIINSDRHGGNFFVAERRGKQHFYPIDMGLGFNARRENFYDGVDGSPEGLKRWRRAPRGGRLNNIDLALRTRAMTAEGRAELRREIVALQRDLKRKEKQFNARAGIQEIFANGPRTPLTAGGRDHFKAVKRMQWIMNTDPDSVLDALID
jgi:hypothetical protein